MMATKSALERFSEPYPVEPEYSAYYEEVDAAIAHEMELERDAKKRKAFRLLSVEDIMQRKPVPHLVKGLLPSQGVAAIYGPSGCGKSFLTLDLIGAIGRGADWFGHRTRPAPIIYICLEGSHGLAKRVEAHLAEIGALPGMHTIDEPYRLVDLNDEAALLEAIKTAGISGAIIVIDTLAQATAGLDENKSDDMMRAIAACQRIQIETGGLVLLIHHTGKDAQRGLRGHSSLVGALDAAIEVSGGRDAPRKWISAKVKDGESGKEYPFELRRVVLGNDEDGDEISSCVVERTQCSPEIVKRSKVPAGGNQRVIWNGLGKLLREAPFSNHMPSDCPPGRPAIRLEEAIHKLRDSLICDPKRKTERTQAAFTRLLSGGFITHKDGWIWVT